MVLSLEQNRVEIIEKLRACPMFEKCSRLETMFDPEVMKFQSDPAVRVMCLRCMEERLNGTVVLSSLP
jgi:hypothetical protein